jgi:hypothetical protein
MGKNENIYIPQTHPSIIVNMSERGRILKSLELDMVFVVLRRSFG